MTNIPSSMAHDKVLSNKTGSDTDLVYPCSSVLCWILVFPS